MTTSTLISSQSRRGRGNSSVWLEDAEPWGGAPATRAYVKRQTDYTCRPAWRAWQRTPLLHREYRALMACRDLGLRVPDVLHFECAGHRAVLVLAEVGAAPLDAAITTDSVARSQILDALGEYLGRFHGAGWYHGALYAHHILVGPQPEHPVWLIDFEKARRARRRRREDLNRFWRHNRYLGSTDKSRLLDAYARGLRFHRARRGVSLPQAAEKRV